jgi:hypothetical protein
MYRDVGQWRDIRRRILEKGIPKKRISAETGISRKTINKMLAHEHPPGYRPRRRRYPKLAPYINTIDRLLHDNNSFPLAVNMTIKNIVQHLRREGKPTCAMRAQPDNCRSSIQGNVMFAAFGRSRW